MKGYEGFQDLWSPSKQTRASGIMPLNSPIETNFPIYNPQSGSTVTSTDPAVSPVVGIMLMVIITVLIAAILSGYAGDLSQTRSKAPSLILEPAVEMNGSVVNMSVLVISAGNGIPTRDLKLIAEWKNLTSSGGNTTTGGHSNSPDGITVYPLGSGPGVRDITGGDSFGNYTLLGGTRLDVDTTDSCSAIFGKNWDHLQEGDILSFRIIHLPSQATIAEYDLVVGGT